ncbi:MAG: hypothetical protein J5556_07495, partial [Deltaproteobacteria bacterium]|nr:hypothetical protein [Deltaproteobacteria bacterium]
QRRRKLHIACDDFLCFASKVASRSLRCSSFPQKVTLGSPARLQASSLRLAVADDFLRGKVPLSLFAPKLNGRPWGGRFVLFNGT